jgi:hypothetical protein
MFGAQAQRGNDVVVIEWEDDPKRHLAVVGRIGGVDGAGPGPEVHLAAEGARGAVSRSCRRASVTVERSTRPPGWTRVMARR